MPGGGGRHLFNCVLGGAQLWRGPRNDSCNPIVYEQDHHRQQHSNTGGVSRSYATKRNRCKMTGYVTQGQSAGLVKSQTGMMAAANFPASSLCLWVIANAMSARRDASLQLGDVTLN